MRAHLKLFTSMLAMALLLLAGSAQAAPDNAEGSTDANSPYVLGQGLRLGNSGFTVGGYGSLQGQNVQNSNSRASLSHMSMFVWWENESRLKFFSEIDSKD